MEYLDYLESESIFILREVAGQFTNSALLFSGGKDSIVVLHLALKAFRPGKLPFPLLHVDTGHNFPEVIQYRDECVARIGERLIVGSVEESIRSGKVKEPQGLNPSRNGIQSVTLLDAIQNGGFDAVIGGARRDEEKARAKERVFSFRNEFGQWDPRIQRPELWSIYNGKIHPGENMRVFPISNWTEQDVWEYIKRERIALPPVYFSHRRKVVVKKGGVFLAQHPSVKVHEGESVEERVVRCRTVGDVTCTGMVESLANDIDAILAEIKDANMSERGTRADDKLSETSMEDRKKEGYF